MTQNPFHDLSMWFLVATTVVTIVNGYHKQGMNSISFVICNMVVYLIILYVKTCICFFFNCFAIELMNGINPKIRFFLILKIGDLNVQFKIFGDDSCNYDCFYNNK